MKVFWTKLNYFVRGGIKHLQKQEKHWFGFLIQ